MGMQSVTDTVTDRNRIGYMVVAPEFGSDQNGTYLSTKMPRNPLPFVLSLSKHERTPSILLGLRVHFDCSLARALSANGVFP
jgi:hypothetical protein